MILDALEEAVKGLMCGAAVLAVLATMFRWPETTLVTLAVVSVSCSIGWVAAR